MTVSPELAGADMLCCLGLGFLLAVLYDGAALLLGRSRPVTLVLDLLAAFLAAVLLCSFAAGRSWSGQVRWYMTAALLAGLWGYFSVLAPASQALRTGLVWLAKRPFSLLTLLILRPLFRLLGRLCRQEQRKIRQIVIKHHKKQLKKQARVLYNSSN